MKIEFHKKPFRWFEGGPADMALQLMCYLAVTILLALTFHSMGVM